MKKTKIERVLEKHYRDLLGLNKAFVASMSRPRLPPPQMTAETIRKKPTKKQLIALARGREVLRSKRFK